MNAVPRYFLIRGRILTILLAGLIFLSIAAVSAGVYTLIMASAAKEEFSNLDPGSLKQAAYIKYYEKQISNTPLLFAGDQKKAQTFILDILMRSISPVTSYYEITMPEGSVHGFMKTFPVKIKASLQTKELFTLLDNLTRTGCLFSADSLSLKKTDDNKDNLISSSRLYLDGQITIYAVDDSLYKQFRTSFRPVNSALYGSADIFYGYGFFAKDPPDPEDLALIKFSQAGAHFLNDDDELYILKPGDRVKNGVVWEINEEKGKVKLLLYDGRPEIREISAEPG